MKRSLSLSLLAASILLLIAAGPVTQKAATSLNERQKALHVLNRLGFGAAPGDVDKVLEMGIDRYIDQQLHPERIADGRIDRLLAKYPTLQLSAEETWDQFERPLLEARKQIKKERAQAPSTMTGDDASKMSTAEADAKASQNELRRQIPPEKRPQRLIAELTAARISRAAYSERQLNEVMVDFWMNHFNIYAAKGQDRVLIGSFERDTIRPHIWGKFEDLLMATAKSPAMLFYLDNARSTAAPENRPAIVRGRREEIGLRKGRGRRLQGSIGDDRRMMSTRAANVRVPAKGGLNENYARELMELHTLGVDGGYTQQDVTELARVLTGWSIARPDDGGGFVFRAALHDTKSKKVLGNSFASGGGIGEGERMIHILAHSPATAHHIAFQLCQRLVADDPPKALVDRVAARFLATDGDLRETVRAVIQSPEFFDPRYYDSKMKSPFEYVVSSIRATGSEMERPATLARQLQQMGEPLYLCQPPTGYSDASNAWMNSGTLIARLNFALDLASGKIAGVKAGSSFIAGSLDPDLNTTIERLSRELVGGDLSAETRRTIDQSLKEHAATGRNEAVVAGLILGSPEFQRQ